MGLFDFIGPASGLLFTLENIIWINLGVFIGCVFAAIPGLSVILCIILFLPVTYTMKAIPGMMFLLGIYCAGGYGGSVSAILINTPGTPHAAATMLDGHPLSKMGRTKAALKIALYASTFGGIFSALVFGVMAWFMRKLELPAVPVLLGMVLGNMTETNFRRALLISDGSPRIFVSSVYCWIFIALIVVVILGILRGKMKEAKNTKAEQ